MLEDPDRTRQVRTLSSGGVDVAGLGGGQQTTQGLSSSSQVVGVEHVGILPGVTRGIPADSHDEAGAEVVSATGSAQRPTCCCPPAGTRNPS